MHASMTSLKVEPLTCTIGAEVSNVNLGVASRDLGLVAELRQLLLEYKVLFFRDQEFTRAEHVAFARHFGELEDHPVVAVLAGHAHLGDRQRPALRLARAQRRAAARRVGLGRRLGSRGR